MYKNISKITVVTSFIGAQTDIEKFLIANHLLYDYGVKHIIVDGNSSPLCFDLHGFDTITYLSRPCSGIYEALNSGIALVDTDYYVVLGCDDVVNKYFFENLVALDSLEYDIISNPVYGCRLELRNKPVKSHLNYIYQHSVSCIIKKSIHEKGGIYDEHMSIGADAKLILSMLDRIKLVNNGLFIVGEYGGGGVSSVKTKESYKDLCRICISNNWYISLIYYFLRYVIL